MQAPFHYAVYHGCAEREIVPMLTRKTFDRIFGVVIHGKPVRHPDQDLRDLPTYTIPEAAIFLGIPERTLRSWYLGEDRIFNPSAVLGEIPLLSFRDLVDSHIVQIARRLHKVPMPRIRTAVKLAQQGGYGDHPLQDKGIRIFARHILHVVPGRGRRKGTAVNLSRYGQTAIPEVVKLYTRRIVKDTKGTPIGLHPWRFWQKDARRRPVAIYPNVMSGRLVVEGTRIPVTLLHAEVESGKTPEQLAQAYRLSVTRVNEALSHFDTKAA